MTYRRSLIVNCNLYSRAKNVKNAIQLVSDTGSEVDYHLRVSSTRRAVWRAKTTKKMQKKKTKKRATARRPKSIERPTTWLIIYFD